MFYVGIVGSHKLTSDQSVRAALRVYDTVLDLMQVHGSDLTVVSGGAEGVDTFADVASQELLKKPAEVYLPKNRRWEPEGFKERNILIAKVSDVLYCVRAQDSLTYGSVWTANYFETLGKGEAVRCWV